MHLIHRTVNVAVNNSMAASVIRDEKTIMWHFCQLL